MIDSNSSPALGKSQRIIGLVLGAVVLLAGVLALILGKEFFYGSALLALGFAGIIAGLTGRVPRWFRG
jgi:hypothetical protein